MPLPADSPILSLPPSRSLDGLRTIGCPSDCQPYEICRSLPSACRALCTRGCLDALGSPPALIWLSPSSPNCDDTITMSFMLSPRRIGRERPQTGAKPGQHLSGAHHGGSEFHRGQSLGMEARLFPLP